jgi:hypothetical protein
MLMEANLQGADLRGTNLNEAILNKANLFKAQLYKAKLNEAKLIGAIIIRADLVKADVLKANLSGADLSEADLSEADLSGANLSGANLRGANLRGATLVETKLADTDLTGCSVHGASAWGLKLSSGTKQQNLIITREGEPEVTVDNIEVAQFVYLMLHNEKIRDAIDTIGKKGVLLLGRFTCGRIEVLERLRDELRKRGFLPIVFNFDNPETKKLTETVNHVDWLRRAEAEAHHVAGHRWGLCKVRALDGRQRDPEHFQAIAYGTEHRCNNGISVKPDLYDGNRRWVARRSRVHRSPL